MDECVKYKVGILTLSDKGSVGERIDTSSQVIRQLIADVGEVVEYQILPDERGKISEALRQWSKQGLDLILTTGGTGFAPRDVTPEATLDVIEKETPGIAEAMRAAGMAKTVHAMLSRGVAGIIGQTLIVNLPGSEKAARENLEAILPALPHALKTLRGETEDCGG
ncbi:MAG: molybdenum cofactor biosynthesis protein [Desulfuromonas sp.]|nr:MAG: molybdenum cofactor biosynthesis protein [Desulfuromonas sp.]